MIRSTLRRVRNRILRHPLRWTDLDHAERSWWTWGTSGPDAQVAHLSLLGILHTLADAIGWDVHLEVDTDGLPADDPAWLDARLVVERIRTTGYPRTSWRWWVHNVIAHPLLPIWPSLGWRIHDATVPDYEVLDDDTETDVDPSLAARIRRLTPEAHPIEVGRVDLSPWPGPGPDVDERVTFAAREACTSATEFIRTQIADAGLDPADYIITVDESPLLRPVAPEDRMTNQVGLPIRVARKGPAPWDPDAYSLPEDMPRTVEDLARAAGLTPEGMEAIDPLGRTWTEHADRDRLAQDLGAAYSVDTTAAERIIARGIEADDPRRLTIPPAPARRREVRAHPFGDTPNLATTVLDQWLDTARATARAQMADRLREQGHDPDEWFIDARLTNLTNDEASIDVTAIPNALMPDEPVEAPTCPSKDCTRGECDDCLTDPATPIAGADIVAGITEERDGWGPTPPTNRDELRRWAHTGWVYKADPRDLATTIVRVIDQAHADNAKVTRQLIAAETRDLAHLDDLAAGNVDPHSGRLAAIIDRRRAELAVLLDSPTATTDRDVQDAVADGPEYAALATTVAQGIASAHKGRLPTGPEGTHPLLPLWFLLDDKLRELIPELDNLVPRRRPQWWLAWVAENEAHANAARIMATGGPSIPTDKVIQFGGALAQTPGAIASGRGIAEQAIGRRIQDRPQA